VAWTCAAPVSVGRSAAHATDFGIVSDLLHHHFNVAVDDGSLCTSALPRDRSIELLCAFFRAAADPKTDTFVVCYCGHADTKTGDWMLRSPEGKAESLSLKLMELWPANSRASAYRVGLLREQWLDRGRRGNGWQAMANVTIQGSGAGDACDGLFTRVWEQYARKPIELNRQMAVKEITDFCQRPAVFNAARALLPVLSAV
jgi:hypothetical protein